MIFNRDGITDQRRANGLLNHKVWGHLVICMEIKLNPYLTLYMNKFQVD